MAVVEMFAAAFKTATTLTISGDVVTVTQSVHIIAAQTGTTDDLDTITDGIDDQTAAGLPLLLLIADSGDTITLKHGADNIVAGNSKDITMDDTNWVLLLKNGSNFDILTAVSQQAAFTPTNVTPDFAFDADTVLVPELADVVGTLIATLQAGNVIG